MTAADDGSYTLTAEEIVALPPPAVLAWLCEPQRMVAWMHGVGAVRVVDGVANAAGCLTEVALDTNARFGWTLHGRIDDVGPTRLVRTYAMASLKAGVLPMGAGKDEYTRVVVYDLAADGPAVTRLRCHVRTAIPGLSPTAARVGARAEQKSLVKSLATLAQLSRGQRPSLLRCLTGSSLSPQAL